MPDFEPTIPSGEPQLMRASGFQRYMNEAVGNPRDGAPSTRLSALGASLTQDLMRFEHEGRAADLIEVLAAGVRHARSITVHLHYGDKVLPLTLFPKERLAHCPIDPQVLVEQRADDPLTVLQVEPAVLRPPGDPDTALVGEEEMYYPLSPLLWALAMHGARAELLPEIAGTAVYRVSPAFDRTMVGPAEPLRSAVMQLGREVASLRQIESWPGMTHELAMRLLNAVYLQVGLIVSRSHPAALNDSWFGGL
jgi:hypothetical protein